MAKYSFKDRFVVDEWSTMGETAERLGWGKNKLFKLLRDNKILDEFNRPLNEYLELNYFKTHIKPREFQRDADLVVLVSVKGVQFIKVLIETLEVTPDMIKVKKDRKFRPSNWIMR